MTKVYWINGVKFPRQADLDSAIKTALNRHHLNIEFRDTFLAAVINTLHPDVRAADQRATGAFVYLTWEEQRRRGLDSADRYRGGKVVIAYFEPLGEWRDVTVYPHKKPARPRLEVKHGFRELIAPYLPKKQPTDRCAYPQCDAKWTELEYEHVAPTFDEIAERCLAYCSDVEVATKFNYSKFVRGRDEWPVLIPATHPAHRALLQAHEDNKWEWLCRYHHRGVSNSA